MKHRFDDGTAYLCSLHDVSLPGEMAHEVLRREARHWFEMKTISYRRQYAAKGANEQIDLVIQTHYEPKARIGMFVVLGNGEQYEIQDCTMIRDQETRKRVTEYTLKRLEDFYDLESE